MTLFAALLVTFSNTWGDGLKSLGVDYNQSSTPIKSTTTLQYSEVEMNGLRYIKIEEGSVSLLVPKQTKYSKRDFENAFCAQRDGVRTEHDIQLIQAQIKVSRSLKMYTGLVQKMIRSNCREDISVPFNAKPEVGLMIDPKDRKNPNLKYKVFVVPNGQESEQIFKNSPSRTQGLTYYSI